MAGHDTVRVIIPIRFLVIFILCFLIIFFPHCGHRNVVNPGDFGHEVQVVNKDSMGWNGSGVNPLTHKGC